MLRTKPPTPTLMIAKNKLQHSSLRLNGDNIFTLSYEENKQQDIGFRFQ